MFSRDDEVSFVLAVGIVDREDDLAVAKVLDRVFDRPKIAGSAPACSSCSLIVQNLPSIVPRIARSRPPQRSAGGREPRAPAWSRPAYAGSARPWTSSSSTAAIVRLTPSIAIEPRSTMYRESSLGSRIDTRAPPEPSSSTRVTWPTPSTCPCTRCPPSRATSVTGRSRFTGSPRSEVPETRPLERLLRQIEPQRRVGALHHREADAVHRQGCPNVAVANDRTGVDDQTAGPRRRDVTTFLNDAGEHAPPPSDRGRSARPVRTPG